MRAWPVLGGLGVLLGSSGALAQDDVVASADAGFEFGGAVVNQTARVKLHAGHAEWRAQVEARNEGAARASAEVWFEAEGAVGGGLSLVEADGRRIEGRLLWAPEAARAFATLAGPGYGDRDPGWMRQMSPGTLAISVVPVLPQQSRRFEYRALLPTRYEDGRHRLVLPEGFEGEVTVESGERGAALFRDDVPLVSGSVVSVDDTRELAIELAATPPVTAELAVVPLGSRNFVRLDVRLASELQAVPRDAALVIAIDGSRSMGRRGVRAARAAASAYLDHFAGGRVKVLRFTRRASWQTADFMSPAVAARALERERESPLENGSDVVEALRVASSALRGVTGERRVLILSDGRAGKALTPSALEQVMRASGALVHVAIVETSSALSVHRLDAHAWAPATHATGGVLWKLLAPEGSLDRSAFTSLVEPWAHPIELEQVGWEAANLALPNPPPRLGRGAGLLDERFSFASPSEVKLTGLLWSKRVELRVRRDAAASSRWSQLLLGSSLAAKLTPAEDARLADLTGSVSATRSLLAVEPGATPAGGSPLLALLDMGAAGDPNAPAEPWGESSADRDCGYCWQRRVTDAVAGGLELSDPEERQVNDERIRARTRELTRRVRTGAARCGIRSGHAEIEATLDEIVSVAIDAPAQPRACLESAVWSLELGPGFTASHQWFRVDLGTR